MMNLLKAAAIAAIFAAGSAAQALTLSFDDLSEGIYASGTSFTSRGVTFRAEVGNSANRAVGVFDTTDPTGDDLDLGSPFVDAAGFLASRGFGNALIVHERSSGVPGDEPDDAAGGGILTLFFAIPQWLTHVDLLDTEEGAAVFLNGTLVGTGTTNVRGKPWSTDNEYARVSFAATKVETLEVNFSGSGALGEIGVVPLPASILFLLGGLGAFGVVKRRQAMA